MIDLNPNYVFSRQREDETVIAVVRKHWCILALRIGWSTLAVIIIIVALIIAQQEALPLAHGWLLFLTYVLVIVIWLLYMVYEYHDWWEDKLILTNQRVLGVDRQGMFSRSVTELDLIEIQDLTYNIQGFLGTIFGLGELTIESAADKKNIYISSIHDPKGLQELVARTAKRVKTQTNLREEEQL